MWKFVPSDKSGKDVAVNDDTGEDRGLVVATRPHKTFETKTMFFTNPTYGREMAQNGAYSSIKWVLHDGTDTATPMESGTADTNTEFHVIQAAQNFDETCSVGMTVHQTDDPLYGTITSVDSATDLDCGADDPCPLGSEAFVIAPKWTFSEPVGTKWVEDSGDVAHANSKSIKCDNATVGDIMQLANVNAHDVPMGAACVNFPAISMWIYVDKDWKDGDYVSLYAMQDAAQVGDRVYLEDYFDYSTYKEWQYINIPTTDMGLSGESIDAIRFENEGREGGKSPKFYLDEITLQTSGTPLDFTVEPDAGTWFIIKEFQTTFVDNVSADNADSTMHQLSYDQLLGVTPTTGYIYKRYSGGESNPASEFRITSLMDLLSLPSAVITNTVSDGTDTMITVGNIYPDGMGYTLKSEDLDRLVFTVDDDLSGLYYMRICVRGYTEQR